MKALALFSGGLDSMLAIKLISSQGIEVKALHIDIGFGAVNLENLDKREEELRARARLAGADFAVVDIKNSYLQEVLFSPKYGYGKAYNPCIDCHGYMFKTAFSMLESEKASFLITGEVLGQRPMSQRAQALRSVSKLSGDDEGLILRPMSALCMSETKPERELWVKRELLEGITGRSRKRQMQMAEDFGWSKDDYESPAGGCLLTLQGFASKIKDHVAHAPLSVAGAALLKLGRHLRLPEGAKMIISRSELENKALLRVMSEHENTGMSFLECDLVGALCLLDNEACKADIELASSLALAYQRLDPSKTSFSLAFRGQKIEAKAASKEEAARFFVLH